MLKSDKKSAENCLKLAGKQESDEIKKMVVV